MEPDTHILLHHRRVIHVRPQAVGTHSILHNTLHGPPGDHGLHKEGVLRGQLPGRQEEAHTDTQNGRLDRVREEEACDFRASVPLHVLAELRPPGR